MSAAADPPVVVRRRAGTLHPHTTPPSVTHSPALPVASRSTPSSPRALAVAVVMHQQQQRQQQLQRPPSVGRQGLTHQLSHSGVHPPATPGLNAGDAVVVVKTEPVSSVSGDFAVPVRRQTYQSCLSGAMATAPSLASPVTQPARAVSDRRHASGEGPSPRASPRPMQSGVQDEAAWEARRRRGAEEDGRYAKSPHTSYSSLRHSPQSRSTQLRDADARHMPSGRLAHAPSASSPAYGMPRNGQPSPRMQLPSFNNLTSREEDAANGKRRRPADADEPLDEDEEAYRARMRRGPADHNGRYSPPDARTHSSASLLPPTSHETRGGPDAPYESSVPLNRRRGDAAQAKASRLHIDTGATSSPTHEQLSDGRRPDGRTPIARSAPPQKMSFEAQEAPPFHPMAAHNHVSAVRAREGEDERHVSSPQQRSSAARPEPPRHVLAPPPASARFVPQTATLPSPAYHSTAFMRGPPAPQGNNPPRTAGLPPQTARLPEHLRSPPSSKTQFLSLFSNFYDSLSDSRTLKATLEDQVRRSNTLLQTLQRTSRVLDASVDRRIREERLVWENRVQGLEARVRELEAAQSGSGSSPPEKKPVIAPAPSSDAAPSGSAPAAESVAAAAASGSAPSSGRKTPPTDEVMDDAEEGDELQSNRDED